MKTELLKRELESLEDHEEFYEYLNKNKDEFKNWQQLMHEQEKKIPELKKRMRIHCNVDKATASKWLHTPPTKRNYVLVIALIMNLDIEDSNHLLKRYAHFQELFPKDPDDIIWIFMIQHRSLFNERYLLEFERLHYSVQRKLQQLLFKHGQKEPADHIHATTETMSAETYHICSETKLVSYICAHRDDLADRNQRLIAFLDHWLNGQSLYHALSGKPVQHLNKHISEIRNGKTLPKRDKLIMLGLALDMPVDTADEMLKTAGFEPMCPKDQLEANIIYQLNQLELSVPDYFHIAQDPKILNDIKNELIQRNDMQLFDQIWESGSLIDYLRQSIKECGMEQIFKNSPLYHLF